MAFESTSVLHKRLLSVFRCDGFCPNLSFEGVHIRRCTHCVLMIIILLVIFMSRLSDDVNMNNLRALFLSLPLSVSLYFSILLSLSLCLVRSRSRSLFLFSVSVFRSLSLSVPVSVPLGACCTAISAFVPVSRPSTEVSTFCSRRFVNC
jgi:hypothetical protein